MNFLWFYFWNRYESETRENILVSNQSSTYIEFKLKRKDSSDISDKKNRFSTFVNATSTNIRTLYRQTKEFILHRTLFLIISGICGMYSSYFFVQNKSKNVLV